jgi:hypothetical protein
MAGTATAQRGFPERQGPWKLLAEAINAPAGRLDAAQARFFSSKLEEIASLLHTAKVFNPPQGLNGSARAGVCSTFVCEQAHTCASVPAFGRLDLMPLCFAAVRGGHPDTEIELRTEADLEINNRYAIFATEALLTPPDGREAAWAPPALRRAGTVTLHRNQRSSIRYIFLTRSGPVLWVPLSRAAIEQGRAAIMAPLGTQLTGMASVELASPACVVGKSELSPLVPERTTEGGLWWP